MESAVIWYPYLTEAAVTGIVHADNPARRAKKRAARGLWGEES